MCTAITITYIYTVSDMYNYQISIQLHVKALICSHTMWGFYGGPDSHLKILNSLHCIKYKIILEN